MTKFGENMESILKSKWAAPAVIAAGVLLALIGGIIGRSVLGWILFVLGILLAAGIIVWRFAQVKELLLGERPWSLVGGAIAAILAITALVLMLVSIGRSQSQPMATVQPTAAPIVTAAATVTATATEAPTETALPTATVTATPVGPIFVCLNENTQVGYSFRVAPRKDALHGGEAAWGACFTVDGKAKGFPGWYHVTIGQEGTAIGVSIDVDETKVQLWVDGYYLESFGVDLETLPEIEVLNP
jgi:hypothetical protein